MKKSPHLHRAFSWLASFALASAGLAQTTGSTGSSADETVRLPEFTVSSGKADPYRPADTMSLARIRAPVLDTPVSINVISRELMNDLSAISSFDATRYFAGVGNGRGSGTAGGINDRQNFRGFESQTRTVDNFSATFIPGTSTSIDTFEPEFIERVEVVLGPDAILNPTGTPGGSMNVITKSPLFDRQNYVRLVVGNYNAQKFSFDSTGALPLGDGKHWAYRAMGSAQDTKTYIPGRFRKYDIGAELTYQFNERSQLTFKYFGLDYAAYANASAPNDNGWLIYDPATIGGMTLADRPTTPGVTYNGANGVDSHSLTTERTNQAEVVYTGTLFDMVSVRLGGQFLEHNNVGDSAYPALSTSEKFNDQTGQVIGVPAFDPTSVPETWRYNKSLGLMYQVQNDYAANFQFSGVTLQPVAGWSIQHAYNPLGRTGTGVMPNANLFAGTYDAPRPDINTFTFGNRGKSEATQKQAYVVSRAGFVSDRVFLVGGVTRTWVSTQQYNYRPSDLSLASYSPLSGFRDSYIGSVLGKPVKNVSVYYTYSTNAILSSFSPTPGVNQALWSQGRQHEYGVKTEFFDQRMSFTADHFQIAQTNVTSPNPLANIDPVHNSGSILTNNTSRGFEFNLIGGITKNLSVIASYTNFKYRDAFGRRVRNVPDEMANLLLNYHFTSGPLNHFNVFGAVSQFGKAPAETQTGFTPLGVPKQVGFYTAAWQVFNAGAGYTFDRYTFNLNVDNLLDKKFAWEPASRLSVSPYPGITFRLTTTIKF